MLHEANSKYLLRLPVEAWNSINSDLSKEDFYNLSLTCRTGLQQFNSKVLEENVEPLWVELHKGLTLKPVFPFPSRFESSHNTEREKHTELIVLGDGLEFERNFDRKRVENAESIEPVKEECTESLGRIQGLLNDDSTSKEQKIRIQAVLDNVVVLEFVLGGVLTLKEACGPESNMAHGRGGIELKQHIEIYQLTKQQAHDIIVKNFNPFRFKIIESAIAYGILNVEQAARLNKKEKIILIETVLRNEVPLGFVLGGVLTLNEACGPKSNMAYGIGGIKLKQDIEKYQLTNQQAHDIIVNDFNPFQNKTIKLAIDKGYLNATQAAGLNMTSVSNIAVPRPKTMFCRNFEDRYIFFATVNKHGLTGTQVNHLAATSWTDKYSNNPLHSEKKLRKALELEFIGLDHAVRVSRHQAARIDLHKLKQLTEKYKLSQDELFKVITKEAYHVCDLEEWVIKEEVLTFDQAINLRPWQRSSEYLRILQQCVRKYGLTTEQVSVYLKDDGVRERKPNLTVDFIERAIENRIVTVNQVIRHDFIESCYVESYLYFLDGVNANERKTQNSTIAFMAAVNMFNKVFLPHLVDADMDVSEFTKIQKDNLDIGLQMRLIRFFSEPDEKKLVDAIVKKNKLSHGEAIHKIFADLLTLYLT